MNLLWFLQSEDSTETASASLNEELKGPRWVLRVTALAFVCFLGWAYFSEIDQVARAPGVKFLALRYRLFNLRMAVF